jgi:hypothetical protein
MPNLLPTLFIVLGACTLVLTLYWLWQSLRHAFTHGEQVRSGGALAVGTGARADLVAQKNALLMVLKDLEAERDTGKLSEADFKDLNARYRARARDVLKALDAQLAPHRDAARALLQGAAAGVPVPVAAAASSAGPAPEGQGTCPSCSVVNDPDAVFCKKCGTRLAQESAS